MYYLLTKKKKKRERERENKIQLLFPKRVMIMEVRILLMYTYLATFCLVPPNTKYAD